MGRTFEWDSSKETKLELVRGTNKARGGTIEASEQYE
jgi:hypothetical protein